MHSDIGQSVLPIMSYATPHQPELLGTGIVLSPNLVLTCSHVLPKASFLGGRKPEIRVLCDQIALEPRSIQNSHGLDLCCLYFDAIPSAVPLQFTNFDSPKGARVTAVGYVVRNGKPGLDIAEELKIIQVQRSENSWRLQYGQLKGGLPRGFSGGPIFVAGSWRTLGMIQLGQESAATSRFIGFERIAAFLKEFRPVIIHAAPPESNSEKSGTSTSGGERGKRNGRNLSISESNISDSIVIQGSNIRGSSIQNNAKPETTKTRKG